MLLGLRNIFIVATLTEIVRPIAEINSYVAAEKAFPINMLRTVFDTNSLTSAKSFNLAHFTKEICFSCLGFLESQISDAILHTSKVCFFTLVTLVEGT